MNWQAMGIATAMLGGCWIFATVACWIQKQGVDPAWIIGGLFVLTILAIGRACR